MQLKLDKPLAIFDLETTGISTTKDRIVEIAILKVAPNGTEQEFRSLVHPEIKIPKECSAIHGIMDEDVANSPTFKEIADDVYQFLTDCDLGGYNSNRFDVPMIIEEFNRAGIDFDIAKRKLIDVQKIFFKMEKRDLTSAYKFYCNETLENAHSAMSDVKATYAVLKGQLDRYEDLKADAQFLHEFSNEVYKVDLAQRFVLNADKEPVFNFGKHKGRKIEDVLNQEPQYYDWMMKNDFPTETKKKLTEIRLKAFNRK